jgi:hypothetical protein
MSDILSFWKNKTMENFLPFHHNILSHFFLCFTLMLNYWCLKHCFIVCRFDVTKGSKQLFILQLKVLDEKRDMHEKLFNNKTSKKPFIFFTHHTCFIACCCCQSLRSLFIKILNISTCWKRKSKFHLLLVNTRNCWQQTK